MFIFLRTFRCLGRVAWRSRFVLGNQRLPFRGRLPAMSADELSAVIAWSMSKRL